MAENYGCSIKGISLSEEQIKYCQNEKQNSKSKDSLGVFTSRLST
jgi:cyclopropane fatty-acyl-phospholipid synthase-like methyltransferase